MSTSPPWSTWWIRPGYDYTNTLARRGWAWEFLRRNPEFAVDWHQSCRLLRVEFATPSVSVLRRQCAQAPIDCWGLHFL